MTESHPQRLRLLAEDADDLAVIAAALQDAVGKVGGVAFDSKARQLTLLFNRYRWEGRGGERVRCALQIGSVLELKTRRIRTGAKDAVIALLTISFEPGEAPGGTISLSFAGGGDLRVEVECIDVVLADVSAPWSTPRTPNHEV